MESSTPTGSSEQRSETYDRAEALGLEHGRNSGTWVIDGSTTFETAFAILRGFEDGDPMALDMAPAPLSGEWAGDPTPASILAELDVDDDDDSADDLLTEYELAFDHGYWDTVCDSARSVLLARHGEIVSDPDYREGRWPTIDNELARIEALISGSRGA